MAMTADLRSHGGPDRSGGGCGDLWGLLLLVRLLLGPYKTCHSFIPIPQIHDYIGQH